MVFALIVLLHSRCWECLGDAYRTRGSYTTAMKAYSKALEYDPAAIYCQYQYVIIHLCVVCLLTCLSGKESFSELLKQDILEATCLMFHLIKSVYLFGVKYFCDN